MRLYLSSFRLGDHPDRLRRLAGPRARVAVVANALDAEPREHRRAGVEREIDDLRGLDLVAGEVDLRSPEATDALGEVDVVWIRGGNAFVLRRALAESAADRLLVDLIEQDTIVYAGYSAGAVVLGPDLHGFEGVDDIGAVAEPVWPGLGVLDRPFVPHVDSPGHPETGACDRLSAHLARRGTAHWALRDGEVLLVRPGRAELLGRKSAPPRP